MFSKSLFKQSCKANGTMWGIITAAVCFMLACVMLIVGGGSIADTKNAIQNTIVEGELTSQMQIRALTYYRLSNHALEHFDKTFVSEMEKAMTEKDVRAAYEKAYKEAIQSGMEEEKAAEAARGAAVKVAYPKAYKASLVNLQVYIGMLIKDSGIEAGSNEALEIMGNVLFVLNPMISKDHYMNDEFYISVGEEPPRYDMTMLIGGEGNEELRKIYRQEYAAKNASVFLAGNIITKENVHKILDELKKYNITEEKYEEFGFNTYDKVYEISTAAIVDFRANYAYRLKNMKAGETEESIAKEITGEITSSLLTSLPKEVSEAVNEIGQVDLYSTLVGSIFFKMAGLLLPIIYLIMTANSLIAGQVDSGSMAYILSSSVKRRTVTCTQAIYLVGSLFAMCTLTTITSMICLRIADVDTDLTYGKLALINLGAFLVLFAMSGICFLASCYFNRSKRSMAIGGGLNMFFLVATMLGLFGSPVLPSILRMEALNSFNYVSIISLFDVESIIEGTTTYIWKLGILLVVGVVCYIVGSEKFAHKDLPL